jgi:hypothetical protein
MKETSMSDDSTRAVLLAILRMQKQQAEYLHRQHGWLISVADTLRESDAALEKKLEQHPFYYQGPRQDVEITTRMYRTIDALISQLEAPVQ